MPPISESRRGASLPASQLQLPPYIPRPLLGVGYARDKSGPPFLAILHGVRRLDAAEGLTGVWTTLFVPNLDGRYPVAVLADVRLVQPGDDISEALADTVSALYVTLHPDTLVRRHEAPALGLPHDLFDWFARPWDISQLLSDGEYTTAPGRLAWADGKTPA